MAMGRVRQGESIWNSAMGRRDGEGRGAIWTGRGWQWGGGHREEEMEKGAMGTVERERCGDGDVEKKGQEEGRLHRWI